MKEMVGKKWNKGKFYGLLFYFCVVEYIFIIKASVTDNGIGWFAQSQ